MTSAPVEEMAPHPPQPRAMASPQAVAPPPVPAPVVDPSWQASVFGWLASRKTYPEEAHQRGEEGRVAIRFTIDRSGRVLDAAIVAPLGRSGSTRRRLPCFGRRRCRPFRPRWRRHASPSRRQCAILFNRITRKLGYSSRTSVLLSIDHSWCSRRTVLFGGIMERCVGQESDDRDAFLTKRGVHRLQKCYVIT